MKSFRVHFILIVIVTLLIAVNGTGAGEAVYSTWNDFEADKLASIWLIKRFIAPEAQIEIYSKGEIIKRGVQFDTPYADLSRKFNLSTFESLLRYYKINDARLNRMGEIIHDVEINVWEEKAFENSREIAVNISVIIEESNSNNEIINRSLKYFDGLFANIIK